MMKKAMKNISIYKSGMYDQGLTYLGFEELAKEARCQRELACDK